MADTGGKLILGGAESELQRHSTSGAQGFMQDQIFASHNFG